jgi:hypothetical protein
MDKRGVRMRQGHIRLHGAEIKKKDKNRIVSVAVYVEQTE